MKYILLILTALAALQWICHHGVPSTTTNSNLRDLKWGKLNFLHTTDTHGWYSGHLNQNQYNANWGDFVLFSIRMKEKAHANNQDLVLVDTGDKHDGNGLGDVTVPNGAKSLPIFMKQEYDIITLGNHELYEWENSKLEYDLVIPEYKDRYVCTNVEIFVNDSFVPFGNKYRYFETPVNHYRILLFAFLFDFDRNNAGTRVTPIEKVIEQSWFLDILKQFPEKDVDVLVIIGHIPVVHEWRELDVLHGFLRRYYPNTIIQYFGGHSHIRDFVVYDENLTALESGRFCETIGWLSIDDDKLGLDKFSRSYLDFNVDAFQHHLNSSELLTRKGEDIKDLIVKTRQLLNLNEYIGHVNNNYYMDYVPVDHPHSLFKLLADKVLPSLETHGNVTERSIIINTGSVRYDLYKGDFTLDTKYIISPFKNDWVKIHLPKAIGLRVSKIMNGGDYINLLGPGQYSMATRPSKKFAAKLENYRQYPIEASSMKLTKGYVTYDDFGSDGDDTIHKPVINYPVPNVVESIQINDDSESHMDLVFYNFLSKNVLQALYQITGDDYSKKIQYYSKDYLGKLLASYISENDV